MFHRGGKSWTEKYMETPRAKYFVKVDDEFLGNLFNSYGLKHEFPAFALAFDLLRKGAYSQERARQMNFTDEEIQEQTEAIYGRLHARYILTKPGLYLMWQKYQSKSYPQCPRVFCQNTQCLPYGISDVPGKKIKMYCPSCGDIYNVTDPDTTDLDGCFFGPNWLHMWLSRYKAGIPRVVRKVYVPKIFGFRICHSSDIEDEEEEEESDT